MKKINKHIEIVRTKSRFINTAYINTLGNKTSKKMLEILSARYETVGISIINTLSDLEEIVSKNPDLVFLGLKQLPQPIQLDDGTFEYIWLSQYFEERGIANTGSAKEALELDLNKERAKLRVAEVGLPTAAFFTALPGEYLAESQLPLQFPLFVKPVSSGGGKGVDGDSVVQNFEQFEAKVEAIHAQFGSISLIEEYLDGREFTVAIIKDPLSVTYRAMPLELVVDKDSRGNRILGQAVKSGEAERVIALTDSVMRKEVNQLALGVFQAMGARDYGRVDIRLNNNGQAQFLETNLVPGLIEGYGYFPQACVMNMNIDYTSMILQIVELALARCRSLEELELTLPDNMVQNNLAIAS